MTYSRCDGIVACRCIKGHHAALTASGNGDFTAESIARVLHDSKRVINYFIDGIVSAESAAQAVSARIKSDDIEFL